MEMDKALQNIHKIFQIFKHILTTMDVRLCSTCSGWEHFRSTLFRIIFQKEKSTFSYRGLRLAICHLGARRATLSVP